MNNIISKKDQRLLYFVWINEEVSLSCFFNVIDIVIILNKLEKLMYGFKISSKNISPKEIASKNITWIEEEKFLIILDMIKPKIIPKIIPRTILKGIFSNVEC